MKQNPEEKVAEILTQRFGPHGLEGLRVFAAVSGGADSVFLLIVLHRLMGRFGYSLQALTVNHRIRPENETSGDADFVQRLCMALEPPVPCVRKDLGQGDADRCSKTRGRGLEEAARHLRYRFFSEQAEAAGPCFVMTGHNRNDRLETVLMRFLEGASGASLAGIARERGIFFRPLLDIDRSEITSWLSRMNIAWREDATNADERYYRNKVRLRLVPLLNSCFTGWDTGVISAASRASLDESLCRSLVTARWSRDGDRIRCGAPDFLAMHPAVRLRFLRDGLSLLASEHRVPSGYLERIARIDGNDVHNGDCIAGSALVLTREGDSFFWGPDIVQNTKSGYLVYIRTCGKYDVPFGTISVFASGDSVRIDRCPGSYSLPLTVRTRVPGDTVRTADGKRKTLKKLMNEWSVRDSDRDLLPLVEQDGQIRAVWGGSLGYPDWYVQI